MTMTRKNPGFTKEKPGFVQATLTGLEPATTGSTVRYSNQLSYSASARLQEIILSSMSLQDVKTVSEIDFQNCIQFFSFGTFFSKFVRTFGLLGLQMGLAAPRGTRKVRSPRSGKRGHELTIFALPLRPLQSPWRHVSKLASTSCWPVGGGPDSSPDTST